METIAEYFTSPGALVGLVVILGELVDRYWDLDGTEAYARAAVIGVVLSAGSYFAGLGFMADLTGTVDVVGNIAIVVLASTGLFQVPGLKAILEFLKIRKG